MLAVVTAVNNANTGTDGSPEALLDGFQPAIIVSLVAAAAGVAVAAVGFRRSSVPDVEAEAEPALDVEPEAQAA